MIGFDRLAHLLSRVCLKGLRRALPRLSPSERLSVLNQLQSRTLGTLGDNEAVMLRRYAAKTIDSCVQRLSAPQQVEVLTDSARKALNRIDNRYLSEACASVINMSRVHPRLVDPASFTASADDPRPIVVGPWQMEVGFELLYWIPYLRAELASLGIPKERVIAVSRGGVDSWYGDIADRYLDILDVMTLQRNSAHGRQEKAEVRARKFARETARASWPNLLRQAFSIGCFIKRASATFR